MKRIQYIYLAIITLVLANSCSNFDELNTNPDSVTKVTSEMLATQVLKNTYRFWNPNPSNFAGGNLWCKHTALLESQPDPSQYFYSYWPYGDLSMYKQLTDLEQMVEFAIGSKQESSFRGLAKFMKAYFGFIATLQMGDIPYSECGKGKEGLTKPKYDKQEDVFASVLADFKAAEEFFAAGENFGGDIMFGGDVSKWRKLSNAFQLKVLQTMSKKASAEHKARFAAIVSAGNLMTSNADIFQLVYSDNPNSSHPYWSGEEKRLYQAPSKMIVDELKRLEDRRLFYFAEPAQYLIDAGKSENDFDAYEGAPTELNINDLYVNNQSGKYSLINKRYVAIKAGDPMLRFTYAEQCFIIAEAIEEGWVTGDAKEYYENGVKAMLEYYMNLPSAASGNHGMPITQDYIDHYFDGAAAYAESGSKTDRLQQILMQRWFIDFFQGNDGNYPQVLRTGYPVFPLDPDTSMNPDDKTLYPQRWKYPTREHTTNTENYQKAIDEQYGGYDGINLAPWYLQ